MPHLVDNYPEFFPTHQTLPLRDDLLQKYLFKTAKWLLGPDPDKLLSLDSGSAWETALSIIYLLEIREILADQKVLNVDLSKQVNIENIENKCVYAVDWLCSISKEDVDSEGVPYKCWDVVTYDTAMVVKALIIAKQKLKGVISSELDEEIGELCTSAVLWMVVRFKDWDSSVTYPVGVLDVSCILSCLIIVLRTDADIYHSAIQSYSVAHEKSTNADMFNYNILGEIAEHLLIKATHPDSQSIKKDIECWWGDHFQSSEVMEALCEYMSFTLARSKDLDDSERKRCKKIERRIYNGSAIFIEESQEEGMWADHIGTIKTLHIYSSLGKYINKDIGTCRKDYRPEIHILFRSLRWVCDKKQFFDDGSFLHTMFLTSFLTQAWLSVYKHWEEADSQILAIYDKFTWSSPVRSSPERTARIEAEFHISELKENIIEKEKVISGIECKAKKRKTWLAIASLTLLLAIIMPSLSVLLGLVHINVGYIFDIIRMGEFLSLASISVAIYLTLVAIIWTRNP